MKFGKAGWSLILGLFGTGLMSVSGAMGQTGVYTPVSSVGYQQAAEVPILTPQQMAVPSPEGAGYQEAVAGCGSANCGCAVGRSCDGDPWTLFGRNCDEPRFNIGGWFQGGYHSKSNDLFNSSPDSFNLHQGWLFLEKEAKSENCELGFGFRFDGMYGIDAGDTQAFGNPANTWDLDPRFQRGGGYGWAIPQLYGEIAKGDLSVKVGHFYTLIGYEVVTAPDNFFYSHAMTMYNSEPFTHTGAIASYSLNDDTTIYGGWTSGWDTGFDFSTGSNFLGGFSTQLDPNVSFTYMTTFGDFGARSANNDDAYSHSLVFDIKLTENLQYIVQSDLLRIASTGEDNVGLNQYWIYQVNDCMSYGARMEWWKGDDVTGYQPHGGLAPTSSTSYYASTFGVNYKLGSNVTIRPEYRYDWSPALDYNQGYFGMDMIATF
ncbi:MAG: outer membrane beta-barrel protein [Mariniblastus sp.]|nr:outer membrane beta-barrel protein [Mariniblastus sp.]